MTVHPTIVLNTCFTRITRKSPSAEISLVLMQIDSFAAITGRHAKTLLAWACMKIAITNTNLTARDELVRLTMFTDAAS
jgi:hypothetical protein